MHSRRAPRADPSGSLQDEVSRDHTQTDEHDQQEVEVLGNGSMEEAFRSRTFENKRRLLYETNAIPEVNDKDIAELEAMHFELMAKKQRFERAQQLER